MSQTHSAYFVITVFVIAIIALVTRYQNKPEKVFGVVLLVLYSSRSVSTEQLISSIANPGVLTLVLLIICSLALEKTSLLRRISQLVIEPSYKSTWVRLFSITTLSSAFLNNTAVVSTMIAPIRANALHPASKLLLPLSFAAILGGTLTLIGTSTNLIVNSMVLDAGLPSLSFFDFSLVGGIAVLGCGLTLFLLSHWLPSNIERADTQAQYFIDAEVEPNSPLIGKTIQRNGLRNLNSLFLVEIHRQGRTISPVSPHELIEENDRLLFCGEIRKVTQLNQFTGLSLFAHKGERLSHDLKEVVLRPESALVNKTLKQIGFRAMFNAAVVAIRRDGHKVSGKLGEVTLRAGDYLVLAVGDDYHQRNNIAKNFIQLQALKADRLLKGPQEIIAVLGFFSAIALAAMKITPLLHNLILLLGVLLLTGALKTNEIIRRLPVQIWLVISSALLLSQALDNSTAVDLLRSAMTEQAEFMSPLSGLIMVYLVTLLLTELVTNNAAAALIFPVAYALATSLDANLHSYILAVAFGASASFISPYGYQTNLMVYNAGQYCIKDYIKIGVPMSITYSGLVLTAITTIYGV
ncbi:MULTISPECIES: SLC13 family permease [Vibrio diabolicus subgroup]|uniref:SLC13 family permease n=1 Tax=Vibrio diabolicus subgroup TaxID=2315253 RepID=UPI000940B6EF|nr:MULTISPECIES: SLC13 family permease [Vibrio diabolicus subgroup]MCR9610467.1 SLC13 family permease [Vibrio alginolyticus]AVF94005.1 SLC13 family permease [Vibrio diabolicus]MCQ9065884.1 SLC13 family permease [Vibrio diabolicus]MCR9472509.1 SLC13 family permease [Vibrio diabolicus]MCR9612216.1 SLC13 family permease [Vibrio alginolyticus]